LEEAFLQRKHMNTMDISLIHGIFRVIFMIALNESAGIPNLNSRLVYNWSVNPTR